MRTTLKKQNRPQQRASRERTTPSPVASGAAHPIEHILYLQRTIGNQAVQRLLRARAGDLEDGSSTKEESRSGFGSRQIAARLAASAPGDIYEQEADRAAKQVMRMGDPQLQGACACEGEQRGEEREHLQTKRLGVDGASRAPAPLMIGEVLSSPGRPLDPETCAFMGRRFGFNFSEVRVHTGPDAAKSARAIHARAYTVGRDVAFADGQFAPATATGKELLAHELAHVVQQSRAGTTIQRAPVPGKPPEPPKAPRVGNPPPKSGGDYYDQAVAEANRKNQNHAQFMYSKLSDKLDSLREMGIRWAYQRWSSDFHKAEQARREDMYHLLAELRDAAEEFDRARSKFHFFEHENEPAIRKKLQDMIDRLDRYLLERDRLITDLFKKEEEVESEDDKFFEQIEQLRGVLEEKPSRAQGWPDFSRDEYNSLMSRIISAAHQSDSIDWKMRGLIQKYLELDPGLANR